MAAISKAEAVWEGDLTSGGGTVTPDSGAFSSLPVTWASRAERVKGKTSPEELIAAAHAACYCMAFSSGLAKAGHKPQRLDTKVEVEFIPGTGITSSTITVRGKVSGISQEEFQKQAEAAKEGCPVSKALHGNVELRLHATLE
jgi:osmotically inducible protein OsmC